MLNLSVHLQLLSLIWRGEGDDIWRCLGQEEAEVALKGCVPCVSPGGGGGWHESCGEDRRQHFLSLYRGVKEVAQRSPNFDTLCLLEV